MLPVSVHFRRLKPDDKEVRELRRGESTRERKGDRKGDRRREKSKTKQ
jgi:hypothetical protein